MNILYLLILDVVNPIIHHPRNHHFYGWYVSLVIPSQGLGAAVPASLQWSLQWSQDSTTPNIT